MKHISQKLSAAAGVAALMVLFLNPVLGFDSDRNLSSKAKQVQEVYTSQIGVREQGVNAGKQVESYLRYVGLPKGNPWCAAFVCWVLGQAGVENPRTGWSPSLFPESRVIWSKGKDLRLGIVEVRRKDPPPAPSGRGIAGRVALTRMASSPNGMGIAGRVALTGMAINPRWLTHPLGEMITVSSPPLDFYDNTKLFLYIVSLFITAKIR